MDTEPSIAGAYRDFSTNTPLIHEPVWGEIDGRSEALGFLIRTLTQYDLVATFFVETVHVAYFTAAPMGRYVEALTSASQDVQLHLHPTWCNFLQSDAPLREDVNDNCHELDVDVLTRLIREGADQIAQWTGRRPTGIRTGNFSVDRKMFGAIRHADLRYSSNICNAMPFTNDPLLRVSGGVREFDGVVEFPVTCFADHGPVGRGRLRPLQVTACSFHEIKSTLEQLHAKNGEVAIIVTHPFEYLKKDDYRYSNLRPNRLVQRRFEKLCAYLAENDDRYDTVALAGAAEQCARNHEEPVLAGNSRAAILRAAQNFINDRL